MTAIDTTRFARKLLREQYDIFLASEPGVLAGRVEALHDMRVAIRRLRNLLKAFRRILPRPEADALEARFRRLSKKLGPARDMDVWMRTLKSMRVFERDGGREFSRRQREVQKRRREAARRVVTAPSTRALNADFRLFLDQPAGEASDITLEKLAARAIRKSLDRVMERSRLPASFPARSAHLLRIACRRARYMAEFFAETPGKPAARLARRLKAVQDVLGDVHDCDICLNHLRGAPLQPPGLAAELARRRRAHVARFGKAWNRLLASVPPFTCQSPVPKAH